VDHEVSFIHYFDRQQRSGLNTPRLANLFGQKAIFRLRKDHERH